MACLNWFCQTLPYSTNDVAAEQSCFSSAGLGWAAAFPVNGSGILIHLEICSATLKEILKNLDSAPAFSFKKARIQSRNIWTTFSKQDMFPDRSGLLSCGLEFRSIWMVRGNPDRSGFGSRLFFTVYCIGIGHTFTT